MQKDPDKLNITVVHDLPHHISGETIQYSLRIVSVNDHLFTLQWAFAISNSLVFNAVFDILPNPSINLPPECYMSLAYVNSFKP